MRGDNANVASQVVSEGLPDGIQNLADDKEYLTGYRRWTPRWENLFKGNRPKVTYSLETSMSRGTE